MKRVLMLLANGVEPLEMAAFTDVLGWATLLGNEPISKPPLECQRLALNGIRHLKCRELLRTCRPMLNVCAHLDKGRSYR